MRRTPVYNPACMATYRKAILTHIDIMGFSDLIDQSKVDERKVSEIARSLQTIKDQMAQGGMRAKKSGKPSGEFDSLNFSDLTVRVSYVNNDDALLDCLDWELFYLVTKQCELALEGTLIRGGISFGDIYVETTSAGLPPDQRLERIIFGPALVRAYELESKLAIFPRIAIAPELMAKVHSATSKIPSTYIQRGDDGIHFVDYLHGTCDTLGYTSEDIDETLKKHRALVSKKLEELSHGADKIRQKALWLALYHNRTIKLMNGPTIGSDHPTDDLDVLATPGIPLNYDAFLIPEAEIDESSSHS
jgi:hypothetical protein